MTPDEHCMVDTNVLVYSTVAGNPWHQHARNWLMALHSQGAVLCAMERCGGHRRLRNHNQTSSLSACTPVN